jgi:hypothetical protein
MLPRNIATKIYKTGQTRGADDDQIFQNRVKRNSTVLIPFSVWINNFVFPPAGTFDNGYIVLIPPTTYFSDANIEHTLSTHNLILGQNSLIYYEKRTDWETYNPAQFEFSIATSRLNPLNGHYVSRVPNLTSARSEKINHGFTSNSSKGAGIRFYEYASDEQINLCRTQLTALVWLCFDSIEEISRISNCSIEETVTTREAILSQASQLDLLDYAKLRNSRIINSDNFAICPLCLKKISILGFLSKVQQAEGREVHDLTITELNLFHINELKINEYNHTVYNLGWGHHHCNVVVKDSGIDETLFWMKEVVEDNISQGYLASY